MLASELTKGNEGQLVSAVLHTRDGLAVEEYGVIALCGHGDPSIELGDGNVYHFSEADTVEFISEEEFLMNYLPMLLSALEEGTYPDEE